MNFIFGTISVMSAYAAFLGYSRSNKIGIKKLCLQVPILIILIFAASIIMVKWYEVPIHNNRISYVVSSNDTPYKQFEGVTTIDIVYDYNTYKGIKGKFYGGVSENIDSRFNITTYLKGIRGGKDSLYNFGGYSFDVTYSYFDNSREDTLRRVSTEEIIEQGRKLIRDNSDYLSYLKAENLEPIKDNQFFGAQLIIDGHFSNRQELYALSWRPMNRHTYLRNDTTIVVSKFLPSDSIVSEDTLKLNNMLELFVPNKITRNNTSITDYCYIPPQDSIIFNRIGVTRPDFSSPDFFFTAEDISRAVEILWIEGLNESNIKLKSLTFDYIGPTEYSDMYPEPDIKDISKITFTDENKILTILKNGLRFHVNFPDMENVQQIRIFIITLILGGLLGLLIRVLYKIIKRTHFYKKIKVHISKRTALTLYVLFITLAFALIILSVIHSHVDAYNLDGGDSFGIFNDIKEL